MIMMKIVLIIMMVMMMMLSRSMYTLLDVESNTECGTTDPKYPPRNVFPGYREARMMMTVTMMMTIKIMMIM